MARYRKIDVRMTLDGRYRRLTPPKPCGQALWWYLLVNPETTNIPGLYRAGEAQLAEALGWPVAGFRRAWAELEREGMAQADWGARVVWIPNAIRYNAPESKSVVTGWRTAWDEIPECPLREAARQAIRGHLAALGEGWAQTWDAACGMRPSISGPQTPRQGVGQAARQAARHPEPQPAGQSGPHQEQEQEQEQEEDPPPSLPAGGEPAPAAPRRGATRSSPSPQEALARDLAARLGSSLRPCQAQVRALRAEGWDLERIRAAIDEHATAGVAPWDWTKLAKGATAPPRHGGLTGEQIRRLTERPPDPDVLGLAAGGAP